MRFVCKLESIGVFNYVARCWFIISTTDDNISEYSLVLSSSGSFEISTFSDFFDTLLKFDKDRIIAGSGKGVISLVSILPNRLVKRIADSEFPVQRLENYCVAWTHSIDESNAAAGKRSASIGLDITEANHQAYRQLLLTTPGLAEYISGSILFEETLYQSTTDEKKFMDVLREQNIVPGIKVDKGLVPLPGSKNESWGKVLDGSASRSAEYYKQGARFAKWRTVVSVPCGPSALAIKESARYAAISQVLADKNMEDGDIEPSPKLIQVVFQNCRGQVDQWVEPYIRVTFERLRYSRYCRS